MLVTKSVPTMQSVAPDVWVTVSSNICKKDSEGCAIFNLELATAHYEQFLSKTIDGKLWASFDDYLFVLENIFVVQKFQSTWVCTCPFFCTELYCNHSIQFLYQEKLVEFKKLKTVVICQSRRGPGRPKKVETTHGYYSSSNKRPDDSIESTTGNKKGRTSAVSTGTGGLTGSISTSAQVQPDMILGAVDSGAALSISDARVLAHAPLQQALANTLRPSTLSTFSQGRGRLIDARSSSQPSLTLYQPRSSWVGMTCSKCRQEGHCARQCTFTPS